MEIYLVGGAVRDELLGLPVKERDWVVVGATPEEIQKAGFRPVGKDFPVFLHPKTHEEYALARTERKTAKGYKGFKFYSAVDVTLEEDLKRRDLTINAIAKASDGTLIDPFHGKSDLKNKILRHVSFAFQEDPVRILRVARFAARFGDFSVHKETIKLMRHIVASGEIDALVAERVWQELQRALELAYPQRFFMVLKECGALKLLFPAIDDKACMLLERAAKENNSARIRFAALTANLIIKDLKELVSRYKIPTAYRDLALLVNKYAAMAANAKQFTITEILKFLQNLDAWRRKERFADFLAVCAIVEKDGIEQIELLKRAQEISSAVTLDEKEYLNLSGAEIKAALLLRRQSLLLTRL